MREKASIKRYLAEGGFGFISRAGVPDLYFHISACGGVDESLLQPGTRVEFGVEITTRGPRAVDLILLG